MSRVVSAEEAVTAIRPGMRIGIGGLQGNHPMTLLRAIARLGTGDLDVAGPAVGMAPELLAAGAQLRRLAAPAMSAEGVIPVAPAFRAAVERGELELWECDEAILLMALRAGAQGLPYMPWRGGAGTDVVALNDDLAEYRDEPTGSLLVRVGAIELDVALLRACEADEHGNVRYHNHSSFADPAFARAARRVIVEVERLIPHDEVLAEPGRTVLDRVDAVVVAPHGSHPYRAAGAIDQDDAWLRQWSDEMRAILKEGGDPSEAGCLRASIDPRDEAQYLQESVGRERLAELTASHG